MCADANRRHDLLLDHIELQFTETQAAKGRPQRAGQLTCNDFDLRDLDRRKFQGTPRPLADGRAEAWRSVRDALALVAHAFV